MEDEKSEWRVRMPILGKAHITVEAETPEEAVHAVVLDHAKRAGEPVHIMARRLDKIAEVKGETGPARLINVVDCCPAPEKGLEEEIYEGLKAEISGP